MCNLLLLKHPVWGDEVFFCILYQFFTTHYIHLRLGEILNSYHIFYEPAPPNILGVLKAKSSTNLQSQEERNTDTVIRGFSSGEQKYSNGELMKEWK